MNTAQLAIPPLPPGTILLVEVGSTAHGTGLPGGEDNDELGVPFADWWDRCLALDAELERMEGNDTFPAGPDRERIITWSTQTHLTAWRT